MREYEDLIEELNKNQWCIELFAQLLDTEISRLREEVDEADLKTVRQNQGGIRVLKKIKSDLKPIEFIRGQDGAYM